MPLSQCGGRLGEPYRNRLYLPCGELPERIKRMKLKTIASIAVLASAFVCTAAEPRSAVSAPALVPMPREVKLTGGTISCSSAPKVELVAGLPKEGYELSVTSNGVMIRASDDAGEFYARQTLAHDTSAPAWRRFRLRGAGRCERRRREIRQRRRPASAPGNP